MFMAEPNTKKEYIEEAKKMMNMTPESARKWQQTQPYQEYRIYRDKQKYRGYTDHVVDRAIQVYRGKASKTQAQKVYQYLKRTRNGNAGERRFGEGRSAVSAQTAAGRNWLYDSTGRYS